MNKEVGIHSDQFQSLTSSLRASVSGIDGIRTNRSFHQTNSKPFTNDLENIVRAIELIQRYQELMHSDVDVLMKTGEEIKEQDRKLSEINGIAMDGPRPIR
ncbi:MULTISPECIES: TIGR04197 family type VII secretion effector [Allobacillus]|uniref:TIGR04197 family type VII secretion effector n=1 Tax=Allobacillus salarius TaxID=1955272 RepID=A0A556PKR0_9BACI|nr:TIGR04197 family type VII secretion effector [Allobacillus salarius]TSJ64967.1 TIGR04197 family type VII secretion effector [Allobacillus salarius]